MLYADDIVLRTSSETILQVVLLINSSIVYNNTEYFRTNTKRINLNVIIVLLEPLTCTTVGV